MPAPKDPEKREEWIRKLSKANKGVTPANKGVTPSPETRKKLSDALIGRPIPLRGRLLPKETRRKMSESKTGEGMGEKNANWRGGSSFEPYPIEFNESLRRKIRERDDYTCRLCGQLDTNHVHHIDYDKKNNLYKNLITLCSRCHGRVSTKKNDWQQFFTKIMQTNRQPFLDAT